VTYRLILGLLVDVDVEVEEQHGRHNQPTQHCTHPTQQHRQTQTAHTEEAVSMERREGGDDSAAHRVL
jgi:hypothetical protein